MIRYYIALIIGVIACSTSAILIKASHTDPAILSGMRLALGAAALSPLAWRDYRRCRREGIAVPLRRTIAPGLVLGAHLLSWTYGARLTLAAQASLIVNLVPVAMPFFLYFLVGERITRGEVIGTGLAIAGVVVLSAHDAAAGNGNLMGNVICFGSMILFAWYLAYGRKNREFPSLWVYLVPVYAIGAAACLLAGAPHLATFAYGSAREWALMVSLAALPTLLGHSLLNFSMRHIRGQIVVLLNTLQFVFATILGWLVFGELPAPAFYIACAVALAGVVLVVRLRAPSEA